MPRFLNMPPKRPALSDSICKKLIKEVRKKECLWNTEHDRYNDRYQTAKAWMEIADIMELPEDRIRVKWKNLRDLFKKEIKRSGSVEQYNGRWRYFDFMKFIAKPNDTANDANGDNEESIVEPKDELEDEEEFAFEVTDEHEEEEEEGNNEEVQVYLEDDTFEEDPIPVKRTKLNSDEDYDVMFLKSLAPYFRQLDPIRKLVVRSKMQDMLLNEIAAQAAQGKKS